MPDRLVGRDFVNHDQTGYFGFDNVAAANVFTPTVQAGAATVLVSTISNLSGASDFRAAIFERVGGAASASVVGIVDIDMSGYPQLTSVSVPVVDGNEYCAVFFQSNQDTGFYYNMAIDTSVGASEAMAGGGEAAKGGSYDNISSDIDMPPLGEGTPYEIAWALEGTAGSAPGIGSVDGDNSVQDGQTGATLTVSGFGSDITQLRAIVGARSVNVLNLAGSGDSYTFDMPDISSLVADQPGIPFGAVTWEATDGTDTATVAGSVDVAAGWSTVTNVGAVITAGSFFEGVTGGAPADGGQIYVPSSVTVNPDGVMDFSADFTGYHWDIDTGVWEVVTVTRPASGVTITNPGNLVLSYSYGSGGHQQK